jgi:hypothetical protein
MKNKHAHFPFHLPAIQTVVAVPIPNLASSSLSLSLSNAEIIPASTVTYYIGSLCCFACEVCIGLFCGCSFTGFLFKFNFN